MSYLRVSVGLCVGQMVPVDLRANSSIRFVLLKDTTCLALGSGTNTRVGAPFYRLTFCNSSVFWQ